MKRVPYCETTNIRHHRTKFSYTSDLPPGIYAFLCYINIFIYDTPSSLRPRQWPLSINFLSQNVMYISCLPSARPACANQTYRFETHNSSVYIPRVNMALTVKRYMSFLTLYAEHLQHPNK